MEDSSSWVGTSLDLSIGVNQIRVEDESTTGALVEELNRVRAENKKLSEMLTVMCENYNTLNSQLNQYNKISKNSDAIRAEASSGFTPSKKRKSPNNSLLLMMKSNGVSEMSSSTDQDESCKKQSEVSVVKEKVSIVSYHIADSSDPTTLVVKDGYQWRKYGQKVTRNSPFPRAYFKCSFAPSCLVKKKVQISVEDQSVVVATYEGEHNHPPPSQMESNSCSNRYTTISSFPPATVKTGLSEPMGTLDLTDPKTLLNNGSENSNPRIDSQEMRDFLVEQMAASLTNDPNFTAALAAAISGRLHQ